MPSLSEGRAVALDDQRQEPPVQKRAKKPAKPWTEIDFVELRANSKKVAPLLAVQGTLILLEAGAADFAETLLAMGYAFGILNLTILHRKRQFLGSSDFRRGCVIVSIVLSVIATMAAPKIPWGWLLG